MTPSLPTGFDWLSMASSFLLVIGLLAVLLFALKRMQSMAGPTGSRRKIQLIETLSAGTRQKIVLLRVNQTELLVGVSPMQIRTLGQWPAEPNDSDPLASQTDPSIAEAIEAVSSSGLRSNPLRGRFL